MKFRRLCIYFFYDPDGTVDEYVLDCLEKMSPHVEQLLVVSNAKLTPHSKKLLSTVKNLKLTERQNIGFDVWAYKHGIDTVGWKRLATFDEVIFMNFTIVGPLYPLHEMFDEMGRRDDDFWGINVHSGEPYDPWGVMPEGFIPKHLQSHFIAVRRRMIQSSEFQNYWDTMRPINSYQEAIGLHEAIFTKKFESYGFRWSSYIDTTDLESLTSYPLMFMPAEVIKHRRCPFFKRKALILSPEDYLGPTMGETVAETIKSVQQIGYDVSKVMPNIIRTGNQSDIRMALNAVTIVEPIPVSSPAPHAAIVAYVTTTQKAKILNTYLVSLTATHTIFIVVGGRHKTIASHFDQHKNIKIITGDYLQFLQSIQQASSEFTLVGVIGLTSYSKNKDRLSQLELYKYGLESLFADPATVRCLQTELLNNQFVGMLASPQATHGNYGTEQAVWKSYINATRRFLAAITNNIPLRKDKLPMSSENGIFWIKSQVFRSFKWQQARTFLAKCQPTQAEHIFNMALPYIIQKSGFLTTYAMPKHIARNALTMLHYRKTQYEQTIVAVLTDRVSTEPVPGRIYYEKKGRLSEKQKIIIEFRRQKDKTLQCEVTARVDSEHLRFDPVEHRGIICKDARIAVNGAQRKLTPLNAISYGDGVDIFLTNDPMYDIEGSVKKGDRITLSMTDMEFLSHMENDTLNNAIQNMKSYYGIQSEAAPKQRVQFTKFLRRVGRAQ